jgi:beta-lactamase regulating signal transducer with metallopeptidase domain
MHLYDLLGAERNGVALQILGAAFARGTAIFMLGAVCALFARGTSAATRHLVWTLTLAGALAAPAIAVFVPHWTVPFASRQAIHGAPAVSELVTVPPDLTGASSNAVLALAPRERPLRDGAPTALASGIDVAPTTDRSLASLGRAAASLAGSIVIESSRITVTPDVTAAPVLVRGSLSGLWTVAAPWLLFVWALGAIAALVPTMAGLIRLSLVVRRARPMRGGRWALLAPSVMRELDVRRRVRFVELDAPVMPMTWGILRPVVLVPSDDFGSTIEQRLDVLRHELAHVRRYDCLTQLVAQLACAIHWFNPLAWLAARELRVERERACDDEVLRAGARASDYADYLLRVARSTRMVGAAALGGLAMARPSQMAGRLLAVLDERRRRGRVSTFAAACAIGVATALVTGVASASTVAPRPAGAAGLTSVPERWTERVEPPVVASADATPSVGAPVPTRDLAAARTQKSDTGPVLHAAAGSSEPCDRSTRDEKSSHTDWTSSDNGAKRWRVMWSQGDCSYEIDARGEIRYNRDVTDIESISSGGQFSIEQHLGDDTKRLVIRPRGDGSLERSYSVNGAAHEYDAGARAWFAEALVALDRQTAFAADQRVPAILERGGVDAVLQEISLLGTDYARRRYYTKLLAMRQLDRGQVKRVVEQAGADMTSDYELAELLVAVSKLDAFNDDSHPAFVTAAKKIGSDYERRRVLNALLQRERLAPATVQALLDAASTIRSDYELAELLIDVSKRYAMNDQTRPTYIKALGSITSDYEHHRVLAAIVAGGGLTPAITRTLLEDATRIGSDYELAEFLIQIGKAGVLDASTRDTYFTAANKIGSDYEHHRALVPLLKRDMLTKDMAKAILASAAKIDSDYECASLLVEVANAITIDDELRPAFEKAADTIQGEYEYGRAMSAVRRRATR